MGYAGGTSEDPTYRRLGDHSETVEIDFDPSVITYEELLKVFFAAHDASARPHSRQYMSAVFFHDEEQERLARAVKTREEARTGRSVLTEIVPLSRFYVAEGYHQKYILQGEAVLLRDFTRIYPEFTDLVDSTAAARVNGYLYGCGTPERLEAELELLGLSEEGAARLKERVGL